MYATGERKLVSPPSQKGVKRSLETCIKIGNSKRGELSPTWRGGITPANKKIRASVEYKLWREAVFKRDDFTCQECGVKSGDGKTVILNSDHIKPFAYFPELRFELSNGRTLCIECHQKTDTFASRARESSLKLAFSL